MVQVSNKQIEILEANVETVGTQSMKRKLEDRKEMILFVYSV